jgi:hypothetical protein
MTYPYTKPVVVYFPKHYKDEERNSFIEAVTKTLKDSDIKVIAAPNDIRIEVLP